MPTLRPQRRGIGVRGAQALALAAGLLPGVATPPSAAAGKATLTLLPTAVEVRSPFTSDGRLEILVPNYLSDEGVAVGDAFDLQRDYEYEVGWYWSPAKGLRVVDPTNGRKRWVSDPRNEKRLRSTCQYAFETTAYCVDDVGDVLYAYSDARGFQILDRGDPEALEVLRRAFSEEGLPRPAPIQVVWKAANGRGNGGLLAAATGVEPEPSQRHPVGLIHSPEHGWQVMSRLDPRLDGGQEVINDPQVFNRRGDSLFNQGHAGGRQDVFLLDGRTGEITLLGIGPEYNNVLCGTLSESRSGCGFSYAGTGYSDPRERTYVSWLFDPERGVRVLDLPDHLSAYHLLPDGDLLVSGQVGRSLLTWYRYSPGRSRLTRLISEKRYARFFPPGTRDISRSGHEITRDGDLLLFLSGTFRGRSITRFLHYFLESNRLLDVRDLIGDAEVVDLDRPGSRPVARRRIEFLDFVNMNSRGESLWFVLVDGRPRAAILSP